MQNKPYVSNRDRLNHTTNEINQHLSGVLGQHPLSPLKNPENNIITEEVKDSSQKKLISDLKSNNKIKYEVNKNRYFKIK